MTVPAFCALVFCAAACGGNGGNGGPEPVLPDAGPDLPKPPDVPTHVFELIEDVVPETGDGVETPLPDGAELPDLEVQELQDEYVQPVDVGPDGCVPQCTLKEGENPDYAAGTVKECSEDGCGSICGYCDYEHQCVLGICEEVCVPQCTLPDGLPKTCGPDGCYGYCPPGCPDNFTCGDDGLCYWDCDITANCEGKECGPDQCGGSCGYCGIASLCNELTGLCEDDPCGAIDKEAGACTNDNVLVECVDGILVETPCQSFGEDYYCKWDGPSQKYVCSEGCVPQCTWEDGTPKQCGYNGCYGECGTCPQGWECEAGTCFPVELGECGWITDKGECIENKLWFCSNNTLYVDDCDLLNKVCQFDMTFLKYKCM